VNEVISQQTARTMMTLLEAVTQHGTGAAASQLKHPFGGKTGTTSDYTDAWFLGFSPSVTCGVWVGYDSRQSLGDKETGSRAALPIWMNVMRVAIQGKDNEKFLADQSDNAPPQAASPSPSPSANPQPPAKSGAASSAKPGAAAATKPPVASPATGLSAKTAKANAAAKPHMAPPPPGPAPKPPAPPAAKRLTPPAASTSAAKPQVKPALPPQHPPANPVGTVKPALNPSPKPPKPRDE
jgi:penicillin-binding protein 1A